MEKQSWPFRGRRDL